jgi:hypothetical protein
MSQRAKADTCVAACAWFTAEDGADNMIVYCMIKCMHKASRLSKAGLQQRRAGLGWCLINSLLGSSATSGHDSPASGHLHTHLIVQRRLDDHTGWTKSTCVLKHGIPHSRTRSRLHLLTPLPLMVW